MDYVGIVGVTYRAITDDIGVEKYHPQVMENLL